MGRRKPRVRLRARAASSTLAVVLVLAAAGAAGLPGCTSGGGGVPSEKESGPIEGKLPRQGEAFVTDWARLAKVYRIAPGRDSGVETIHFGERSSIHVLAVQGTYPLHAHAKSDTTYVIVEGSGELLLPGGKREKIAAGQLVHVPQGAGHGIATGDGADALRALLVLSPPFQDGDTLMGEGLPGAAPPKVVDLDRAVPAPSGGGTARAELARGPNASVHLVATNASLPLHVHAKHAETVLVIGGRGVCRIGDGTGGETPCPSQPGSIFHIPEKRSHAYEHQAILRGGEAGAETRALSIFSPAFDGTDRIEAPPPMNEEPDPKKRPDERYVWIPGHWEFGAGWTWSPGRWHLPEDSPSKEKPGEAERPAAKGAADGLPPEPASKRRFLPPR